MEDKTPVVIDIRERMKMFCKKYEFKPKGKEVEKKFDKKLRDKKG